MEILYENLLLLDWRQVAMWVIGGVLIFLAIKKNMEPSLLLPIGFGAILVNLPLSGAVDQVYDGVTEPGIIDVLFNAGIANELFPLILFVGIGAMIDFTPAIIEPETDDLRRGGPVRYFLHAVYGYAAGLRTA